ncbi:MAG TPA: ATP-binding protein, partial [Myxococcota bacterium]|nr:ATP-binding protein [Myxococcota bacterium]
FTARAAAVEMAAAHVALQQRYRELDAARSQLAWQARQLDTANRISQVIHGELNLPRTLEAVVNALLDVADFSAAEIVIETELEGVALRERAGRGSTPPGVVALHLPIVARRSWVGTLTLWPKAQAGGHATGEISEYLLPTVSMAIDDALTFTALAHYRDKLEERVETRTAELAQARDSLAATVQNLQEAQAARDRIFANINHEIRTPLALIMLSVNDIKRRILDAHAQEVAAIETSAARLLNLVDGLLLLAAGQEGKLRINPRSIDLAVFLSQAANLWGKAAAGANLHLRYDGPSRQTAWVDDTAVDRIVSNLLSNAIKFTPPGGSIVLALTSGTTVHQISVTDSGAGIDDELKPRIFGRFEQGRRPARHGWRGSGIGLSLVKELAEAHGGSAGIETAPGGGAHFIVSLPAAPPDGRDATSVVPAAPPSPPETFGLVAPEGPEGAPLPEGGAATILVAEDDPQLRRAIQDLLHSKYRVISAADGLSAWALCQKHLPDLLVSDVEMPGLDGVELSRRFQGLPGNRLAPTLLLTAHGDRDARLSGLGAGAMDYILKPFEPEELLARVRNHLATRSLALRLSESEKLASLGVLSAGLAHELRNPANAVVNAVEPLVELLPPALLAPGTATADLIGVIQAGAEQLRSLAQQLLGFVRPGHLAMREESFETLLCRALSMASGPLKGVEVRKALAHRGPLLCAAPLLVQVFTNLFENAAHAAGSKGWIVIETRQSEGRFIIEVTDSGPGVPPAMRERIFEPFFTTKAPGAGTGLGLFTARTIIERHRGTLRVVDRADRRSAFRIDLPAEAPPQTPERSASR